MAALWTAFIARCCGINLPWMAPAAMFLAVWMIYAADRLLDARVLDSHWPKARPLGEFPPPHLEERHRFHYHHRVFFCVFVAIASMLLIALLPHLDARALLLYSTLAALLGAWMLLIHVRPLSSAGMKRLPKEFAVGIFFAAAVFVPTIARALQLQVSLVPAAGLFAAVCSLNCLFVFAWENSVAPQSAHWTTRYAVHHLRGLALILTVVGAALAWRHSPARVPAFACALSTVLLLLLHTQRHRLSALHLRAAVDLALLTPLALWPFLSRIR